MKRSPALLAVLTLAAPTFAQGGDSCATAQDVGSALAFPYDIWSATTTGAPACDNSFSGTASFWYEVWFIWTAPTTDTWIMTNTGPDLMVGAFDGDNCGTASLVTCHDDLGFDKVAFDAVAGTRYLLLVGSWSISFWGAGTVELAPAPAPVLNPANGNWYDLTGFRVEQRTRFPALDRNREPYPRSPAAWAPNRCP